jgi:hypothetical protein
MSLIVDNSEGGKPTTHVPKKEQTESTERFIRRPGEMLDSND